MQCVDEQYDVVITTNSGYPLDENLYQSVKGMSAAARIVAHGGTIILAAECREGFPSGSAYERLLRNSAGPAELLQHLRDADRPFPDQWQAQIQALILKRAENTSVQPDERRRCACRAFESVSRHSAGSSENF